MSDDDLPEADRADGAPHPRETAEIYGQDAAKAQLLDAATGTRMHHAWLITGPKGVGKATLAWSLARFLIATPPETEDAGLFGEAPKPTSLDIPQDHPVAHRMAALSEPGLLLIRRAWDRDKKRLKTQITVDEVRKLGSFFGLSSTDGGRRVVIVDSIDDMNPSAANALLKVLEEPPKNAILLLVSHAPARLLPTIRSRCRELRLPALSPDALTAALAQAGHPDPDPALAPLAAGSVGEAIRLATQNGPALYGEILALLATCPSLDRPRAQKFAEHITQRGHEDRTAVALNLLDLALSRTARTGTGLAPLPATPDEPDILKRLAPNPASAQKWAALQQDLSQRIGHGRAVNVDAQSLILDAFLKINETASRP